MPKVYRSESVDKVKVAREFTFIDSGINEPEIDFDHIERARIVECHHCSVCN